MAPTTTLAERLRYAMALRDLRPIDLDRAVAQELGVSYHPGWSHDVLSEQTKAPRAPRLMAAAKVLGISEKWLMRGEGPVESATGERRETYADLPGWEDSLEDPAVSAMPRWIVDAVGRANVMVRPECVTPAIVVQAVTFWLACAPPEERQAAAHSEERRRREGNK